MMGFDQRFADRQAEPESAELRTIALLESVENLRERFRVDPHPRIRNFDLERAIHVRGPNFESTAFRGELHGILDQVPKDLLKAGRIGFEPNFVGRKSVRKASRFFSI